MKKKLPIIIVVLLLLIGGGTTAWFVTNKPEKPPEEKVEEKKKKRILEPVNVIETSKRPYIKIIPHGDGINIEIEIVDIKINATSVEYELEYQAGSLLQGAFGELDLANIPANKEILLGSCSAGGACTYHKDVKGGSLVTRFNTGKENYALKSDWKYIDNKAGESEFGSKDQKFQISSKDLAKNRFIVIFNTAGYPEDLEGTPVSDPYSFVSSSKMSGTAELTMRAEEEGDLIIKGFDGEEWHEFEGEIDGKMITAEVDLMELYVVVKK